MSAGSSEQIQDHSGPNGDSPPEAPTLAEVRALILSIAGPALAAGPVEERSDDFDLRAGGMIDSLGFIELIAAVEDELRIEIDFDDLDPEQITVLGPLSRHLHAQATARRREP